MNVSEPIRRNAARAPDAIAFVGARGASVTYIELERTIDSIARSVLALGLVPGATAVIATADLYRYLVLALALGRVGVAHGPQMLPAEFADIAFVEAPDQALAGVRVVSIAEVWPARLAAEGEPVRIHDYSAAVFKLCPSSGTTGARKFVPVSHELTARRMDLRLRHDHARATDRRGTAEARQACLIEPSTSYGFSSCLLVLHGGGAVLEPNLDAAEIPGWLTRSRVNTLVLSPIALAKVVEVLPALRAANALDIVEVGGGALSEQILSLAQQRLSSNVFVNYGSTESGRISGAPAAMVAGIPGAVGYVYPGTELRVEDDEGRSLPFGEEGVLALRSDRNASSYLGRPEVSAQVFRNGWVYPGDRAVVGADGLLVIAGRTDDVINQGGVKVNPQALEDAIMALGSLREVAVFGVANDAGETSVCAAIVPTVPLDANAFHARVREGLGPRAPVFIMHMESLPRNANGKVLRTELARIARKASGG